MPDDVILLAHGSGGKLSHDLVTRLFLPHFSNPTLLRLEDSAVLPLPESPNPESTDSPIYQSTNLSRSKIAGAGLRPSPAGTVRDRPERPKLDLLNLPIPTPRLAFTTDSYTITPLFFPGGDIGHLAVCGTVNDLSMAGARPLWLTVGFILEEGLPMSTLERIVKSMAATAVAAGVEIVAGDTKVVDRGSADKIFINTAGVGVVPPGVDVSGDRARPGDVVLVSGTVGDHGMTILTQREGLSFSTPLESDSAPLNGLVADLLAAIPPGALRSLRDPTRGGLATTLVELAGRSAAGIEIEESAVPVRDAVRAACELLGLDPLYVANEGKMVAIVTPEVAGAALAAMRAHEYGRDAAIIGRVTADHPGRVVLRTPLGARRILDMLAGEQLPRIC